MKTFVKKILLLLGSAAVFCAGTPLQVLAAEAGGEAAGMVPLALCIPFAGLSAGQSGVVGKAPDSCSCILVSFVYNSLCSHVWIRDGAGNGAGMSGG